jgi:WD40 repeat protein
MSFIKLKEFVGHVGGVFQIQYADNFIYSVAADSFVARWDLKNGVQDKFTIRLPEAAYALNVDAVSNQLFVGLKNGALHVFDLNKKVEVKHFTQHRSAIFCVQINEVKSQWYAADADGNLSIWDIQSNDLLLFLPLNCGKIRRIATSPDGAFVALACQDGTVRLFDTTFFNEFKVLKAHEGGATAIHFIGEDKLVSGGKDAHLKLWDLQSGELQKSIPAHNFVVYDILKVSDDFWVTCSRDKTIKIWNANLEKVEQRIEFKNGGHRHSVNSLTYIYSGEFASCSDDGKVFIWGSDQKS